MTNLHSWELTERSLGCPDRSGWRSYLRGESSKTIFFAGFEPRSGGMMEPAMMI